jgi:hypothetical protein
MYRLVLQTNDQRHKFIEIYIIKYTIRCSYD